jgi:hypothetical protein
VLNLGSNDGGLQRGGLAAGAASGQLAHLACCACKARMLRSYDDSADGMPAGIDGPLPNDLSQLPRLEEINLEYTQVGHGAAAARVRWNSQKCDAQLAWCCPSRPCHHPC